MTDSCEIVRGYLNAFWSCRWDELRELLAEDAIYLDPLLVEPVQGREAILEVLAYCHTWGTYEGVILSLFGAAGQVAAELRIQGIVTAPPDGMSEAVVGKRFDFAEVDVFDLDAYGRVRRQAIYADALSLTQQLGEKFL